MCNGKHMKALSIYIVQIIDSPQISNLSKLHTTETVSFWPFLLLSILNMQTQPFGQICKICQVVFAQSSCSVKTNRKNKWNRVSFFIKLIYHNHVITWFPVQFETNKHEYYLIFKARLTIWAVFEKFTSAYLFHIAQGSLS